MIVIMGSEQELKNDNDLSILARKWELGANLLKDTEVVVPRGEGGIRGLDRFVLSRYDQITGKAILKKQGKGVVEEKRMSRVELLNLNNPVKTATEWYAWYYWTTGSRYVLFPGQINDQLMTVDEFQSQLQGLDFKNKDRWESVVGQFRKNLDRLEGRDDETETQKKILALVREPLNDGELKSSKDGLLGRREIVASGKPYLLFQHRTYSRNLEETGMRDEDLWRGYLQVELSDLPEMVEILKKMGKTMADRDESLSFKYIYATAEKIAEGIVIGEFQGLKEDDPRIVVYFKDKESRQKFFDELVKDHYKDMVEMSSRRSGKPRRPGADVMIDTSTNKEFRHLEMLGQPGFSEDVAADPDWRNKVRGEHTQRT